MGIDCRREPSPTETLSPLDLPSPGFDSRKTSVDEHEDHYSSRPPSRASAGEREGKYCRIL